MKRARSHASQTRPSCNASLEQVIALAGGGALAQAREALEPLIAAQPRRADLHHLMGLLCAELNDLERAVAAHRSAVALGAAQAQYHHDLGASLFALRQWQAATDAFGAARNLDPLGYNTSQAMARCQYELHCEQGFRKREDWDLDQAMNHARTAVVLCPQERLGHTLTGILEYELGNYALSCASHETAKALSRADDGEGSGLIRQSRARLLAHANVPDADLSAPATLSQRSFDALYRQFLETGRLPNAAQNQRYALAPQPFADPSTGDDGFQRAVAAALSHDIQLCEQVLLEWLQAGDDTTLRTLHDAEGRICFAPAAQSAPAATRTGLLLEMTLKCAQSTLRHAAGFVLGTHLRNAELPRLAQRIVEFLDPDFYTSRKRLQLFSPLTGKQERCVVFGTCITRGLVYLLNLSDAFRRHFRIDAYVTNSASRAMRDFVVSEEVVSSCGLLLHMPPQWADWGNDGFYVDLLARFDAAVPRITFPYPVFHPLWPYHCNDTRDQDPAVRNAQGLSGMYPYGDSFVLGLMRSHPFASAQEIAAMYAATDLSETIDLNALLRQSLRHQRIKEGSTDVKILDFIEESFASKRLLLAVNHVSNLSLIHMANQVLHMLSMPRLPETIADQLRDLIEPQIPIHPSILRYNNIKYLTPDSRYNVDSWRHLTFLEYIEQYVSYA